MSYAIKRGGKLVLRALPSKAVADRIAAVQGGTVIIDPRCVRR